MLRCRGAFCVFFVLVSTGLAADPSRQRRFIYNSDADNMFDYVMTAIKPADVHTYVDEIAAAGVTTLYMCPNVGMVMNYPSKVTEMLGSGVSPAIAKHMDDKAAKGTLERAAVNLRTLVKDGHDPLGLVIERARAKKMEAFISFRLNECHCVDQPDTPPGVLIISRAWPKNPQWRIGKAGDKLDKVYQEILGPRTSPVVGTWLPGGFNFAVPEVRQLRLAEIRECCERYPINGLDLDFQRFPMFFRSGEEEANLKTMTTFVRQVREMTRAIGEKRGRAILLSARIMAKPEQNRAIGLDPIAWAQEGLIDIIVASHYLRNDFDLPLSAYRKLLPEKIPLYGSIEVEPEADTYRRLARHLYKEGADGIMVFNYFTTRESGKEPNFKLLTELGDPAKIQAEKK